MDFFKDEANQCLGIAEGKFKKGDLVGAKYWTREALHLHPNLPDAVKFSAVSDVHIAALVKVGINEPEPDYYGILQVKPLSDDSTIKKQCRNLSKLVHPDKNKESMKDEAEAAFKLIGEAFRVLSDEETRFQHDSKQGEKPTAKESPKPTYCTHQPQQRDVKRGGKPRVNPQPQPQPRKQESPKATYAANQPQHKAAARPTPAPGAQAFQAPNTFLATCPYCQTQHECSHRFLNSEIVCRNNYCRSHFPANGINVYPANGASAPVLASGLSGIRDPVLDGANWYEMYDDHLAPNYGASTNRTSWINLLSIFSGANPYVDYRNSQPLGQFWLSAFYLLVLSFLVVLFVKYVILQFM